MNIQPSLSKTLFASLFSALLAAPLGAQESETLVTVNGTAVKKSEVQERIWGLHANDALNQMVDEIVVQQAHAAFVEKASKKDKKEWDKEVDERVAKVKKQFKDEKAFEEQLKKSGSTLEALRKQLETQVQRERMVIQAKKIEVTPKEVKEFFEANKDKLGNQDAVRLRHILVADEKQAKDLLVALRVGADFSRLAQELSLDTGSRDRGGDLGFISRGMLIPEIEQAAFGLKPGAFSDVVATKLGFHILKVEEKRDPKPAVFKDIETDLTLAILTQKINQAWPAWVKETREAAKIDLSPGVTTTGPAAPAPAAPRAN